MQMEPLGKVLPRLLYPYVQRWGEQSMAFALLSRLLADEMFQMLLEKYWDEISTLIASYTPRQGPSRGNGQGYSPRQDPSSSDSGELRGLRDRVLAMEAHQEAQQALF